MESGSQLGNYVIKDRLGRGATAEVYRALQPAIDRDVAIKVMMPHLLDSPDFAARFQREARAMGQLQHPNIGRVIDFDATGERPYMVMEHLVGGSLDDLMRSVGGPLEIDFALGVTRQLADALAYAHSMGMVHRDIKPANVMFTDEAHGCAMLMDFGMARLVDEGMTATGAILGTPAFMAPEQMRGEPVGPQADLYSLGVMLYEMVTGQPPFQGDSIHSLMLKHIDAPIPLAREFAPAVTPELDALITTALAKQPSDRFADAAAMVTAIDQLRGRVSGEQFATAAPAETPAPTGTPAAASRARKAPATTLGGLGAPISPSGSGKRIGFIAALVALAVLAAGAVFLLTRGGETATVDSLDETPLASEVAAEPEEAQPAEPAPPEPAPTETAAPTAQPAPSEPDEDDPQPPAEVVLSPTAQRAAFDPAAAPAVFITNVRMDGENLVLTWDRSRPPAPGTEYRAVIGGDPDLLLGPLDVDADGRGTVRAVVPAYLSSEFSIQRLDLDGGAPSVVVYENTLAPNARASFDELLDVAADVDRELAIALDHLALIGDELSAGDLDTARRHVEHVINIIDGVDGEKFGDLDGSGLAENPGDGVGLLPYATRYLDDAEPPSELPDLFRSLAAGTVPLLPDAQDFGLRVLAADSVDEAQASFDSMQQSLTTAAAQLDAVADLLRTQIVEELVGPALHLTGTDTSSGTLALLPSTGQAIVSASGTPTGIRIAVGEAEPVAIPASGFVLFDAPDDLATFGPVALTNSSGQTLTSAVFDPATIQIIEEIAAVDTGVLSSLNGQAQIVADHAELMRQEVAAGNHTEVRRHAEHVVNIIVGEQGDLFGDLDGDGIAQNPGDGTGALVYLDQLDALVAELPQTTVDQRFHVHAYRASIGAIRTRLLATQREATRVLATDSADEAEAPMIAAVAQSIAALEGGDDDGSGSIDFDEAGIRLLGPQASTLLSVPMEP